MAKAARLTALLAAALAVTAPAQAARPKPGAVRPVALPQHVVQGTNATISVRVHAGAACTLGFRYRGGSLQPGLARAVAVGGVASWSWLVPTSVQAGPATASVRCGRLGSLSRRVVVVGRLNPPRVVVEKSGFSTRPGLDGGTRLSYGVIVHHDSTAQDASGVVVQTNFVLADDHLLGTDTQRIDGVAAGTDFAIGNTVTFPGAAPVARLEVVVEVDHFEPAAMHVPTLANIHLVPNLYSPSWVGSIEGEIQNTDPSLTMARATLSGVVLDSAGDILGGTAGGFLLESLPAGVRAFVELGNGLDVIPFGSAASAIVSVSPTWAPAAG